MYQQTRTLSRFAAVLAASAALWATGLGCGTPAPGEGPAGPGGPKAPGPAAQVTCASLCGHIQAAGCMNFNPQCEQACQTQIVEATPKGCSTQLADLLRCGAAAKVVCTNEGPEVQGCDAQDAALARCAQDAGNMGQRCLPDETVPPDISKAECGAKRQTPRLRDCPGGKPDPACVDAPSGGANLYCCP